MNYIEPEMVVISFRKNIVTTSPMNETEIGGSGGTGGIPDDSVIDFGNGGFN